MLGFPQGLTNEEYTLMGWHDNPRFNYKKQFQRLKKVHNFTFDVRQKLTPQRKAAIKKAFNRNIDFLSKIESGKYTFIKAKKSQIKNLSNQFPHTNKGIIYNHPVQPGETRKTKIFGTGKNTKLLDEIGFAHPGKELKGLKEFKFYLPFPESLPVDMREMWVDMVVDTLNPNFVSMAINGYSGLAGKQPKSAAKYAADLTDRLGKKGQEIITGIYIVFLRKHGGQWLTKIEQRIESLY